MSYQIHTSECVLIGREKSKEFDEIISVYSKDFGLISVICYGLLRPHSKMRFHIDRGYILHLELIKGREFYILVGAKKGLCIMKPTQLLVWQSCAKILIQFFGEHEEDAHTIFETWKSTFIFALEYYERKDITIIVILYFTIHALYNAGLWPYSQFANVYDSSIELSALVIENHKKEIEDLLKRIINNIA